MHAQERFFEMDVRRHVTAGRLSELFGEETLETDRVVRTMGWRRVAEREWAVIEPRTRAALEAYADGVNAYLDSHGPSRDRGGVLRAPARRARLHARAVDAGRLPGLAQGDGVGPARQHGRRDRPGPRRRSTTRRSEVAELYPAYPYDDHPPIVGQGAVVDGVFDQAADGRHPQPGAAGVTADRAARLARVQDALDGLPALVGRGDGIGSNSWVVGGEHSATGQPLLANDPHLGISLPGIWMQMGLHCRTVARTARWTSRASPSRGCRA